MDENDQQAYESRVHQRLGQTKNQIRSYETKLDEIKAASSGWTSELEEAIDGFVQQHGLRPLHMKRDLKVALIKHEYEATILERGYAQENLTPYQVSLVRWYDVTRTPSFFFLLDRFKWHNVSTK